MNTDVKSQIIYKLGMVLVLVIAIGGYVLWKGNPITDLKLEKETVEYVNVNYPNIADKVQKGYSGVYYREGKWYVTFTAEDDLLMTFQLIYDKKGNLIYDGYIDTYLKGGTLYSYFDEEYRKIVLDAFNDTYTHGIPVSGISLGSVVNGVRAQAGFDNATHIGFETYEGPVLDITKTYTVEELANEYGYIEFYYPDDEKTEEQMYKRGLEVRAIVEKYNLPFKRISVAYNIFEGAFDLTYEELFSDNLAEILKEKHIVKQ